MWLTLINFVILLNLTFQKKTSKPSIKNYKIATTILFIFISSLRQEAVGNDTWGSSLL